MREAFTRGQHLFLSITASSCAPGTQSGRTSWLEKGLCEMTWRVSHSSGRKRHKSFLSLVLQAERMLCFVYLFIYFSKEIITFVAGCSPCMPVHGTTKVFFFFLTIASTFFLLQEWFASFPGMKKPWTFYEVFILWRVDVLCKTQELIELGGRGSGAQSELF